MVFVSSVVIFFCVILRLTYVAYLNSSSKNAFFYFLFRPPFALAYYLDAHIVFRAHIVVERGFVGANLRCVLLRKTIRYCETVSREDVGAI